MKWQIHKITKKHIGIILKFYESYDSGVVFKQYEYIQDILPGGMDYEYFYYDLDLCRWDKHKCGYYCEGKCCHWEPVSDLELVILGIPFPDGYVGEHDRI
jgi:hypothetical protein